MYRVSIYADKLSSWAAIGVHFNWDDGIYFGFYVLRWSIGIQIRKGI
jgi:hypothetical protein